MLYIGSFREAGIDMDIGHVQDVIRVPRPQQQSRGFIQMTGRDAAMTFINVRHGGH
jgi:hypothetical protein